MKKILLITTLFIPVLLFGQSGKFQISGKIGNLSKPAKTYITYIVNDAVQMDSCIMVNGNFILSGTIEEPVTATIFLSRDGIPPRQKKSWAEIEMLPIYLEARNLRVSSADSIAHADVLDSKVNVELKELNTKLRPNTDKINKFNVEYAAATEERKKLMINDGQALSEERNTIMTHFVKEHPDSPVSLDQIQVIGGQNPDIRIVQPLFDGLSTRIKESIAGKKYAADLQKLSNTSIGAIAPDFEQADPAGRMVKLSSYRGKYVLLDFWASWCGPCRAENPNLVKNYGLYHPKGFEVLGVSLDQPGKKEAWLKAIKADNLSWTQISDLQFWNNAAVVLYGITGIPANFLIGPDGKIVAKNLKGEDLTKKLEEIFGKL